MLTIKDRAIFEICLVAFSVIPLCPEPLLLQPERRPHGKAHAQAACQPHTGLKKPEATDGVTQLQKLHISTLLRVIERERGERGKENRKDRTKRDVITAY